MTLRMQTTRKVFPFIFPHEVRLSDDSEGVEDISPGSGCEAAATLGKLSNNDSPPPAGGRGLGVGERLFIETQFAGIFGTVSAFFVKIRAIRVSVAFLQFRNPQSALRNWR